MDLEGNSLHAHYYKISLNTNFKPCLAGLVIAFAHLWLRFSQVPAFLVVHHTGSLIHDLGASNFCFSFP